MKFVGRANSQVLFVHEGTGVIVDSEFGLVTASGKADFLQRSQKWSSGEYTEADENLASASLLSLDAATAAAQGRMYTIPRGVQNAAKRALASTAEFSLGTPAGWATARLLAKGGQVTMGQLRHINRFLASHEASNDSYGLWGGEAASRWASAIIDRETAVTASVEGEEGAGFIEGFTLDADAAPEFLARIHEDGAGIDRLYKIDFDGQVYVWDDTAWTDLGNVDGDIWTHDRALDDISDVAEKRHIVIDPDSAVMIGARLSVDPFTKVAIEDLDADEAALIAEAGDSVDWEVVDSAMVAAGEVDLTPGVDTPEERAERATQQVRDKNGKFAKTGSRVMIGGDPSKTGNITRVNPANGTVSVLLESGGSVDVSGRSVEGIGAYTATIPGKPVEVPRVDTTGILAEPRTPINRVGAQLPGTLPQMGSEDLHALLANWPAWVKSQREAFKPLEDSEPVKVDQPSEHPLVGEWLKKRDRDRAAANAVWSNPIRASVEPDAEMTPDNSDVQPLYMAVVAPEDPRAVLQLVSLVPAGPQTTAPMTYVREDGKWTRDEQVLISLNSATPPPVVPLDTETLDDVLKQVDGKTDVPADSPAETVAASAATRIPLDLADMILWGPHPEVIAASSGSQSMLFEVSEAQDALVAAGGLDRNRGGAEKLRRYWTIGKGGAKIRWGTGGDWTRCVRHLTKYLGARAKGYCALRHKEMTGQWTGDKRHRQMYGRTAGLSFSTEVIPTTDEFTEKWILNAKAEEARERMGLVAAAVSEEVGASFTIPLVLPEGAFSGDNRIALPGSLDIRELPVALMWQFKTAKGHDGSVLVGRVDFMERTDQGIGNAYGVFDTGVWGREAERLVRNGFLRWVSADMDQFEADASEPEATEAGEDDSSISSERITIKKARVMAVTLVPKPSFQECKIYLEDDITPEEEIEVSDIAEDLNESEEVALVAAGYIASAIPVAPPKSWFENPELSGPTPLNVDDSGRVFGHIAVWNQSHIGMGGNTKPPRSKSDYAYFQTGVLRTGEGEDINVGQLTLAGGHASLYASADQAVKHYDDTHSAIADVRAGEDQHGIWVSGGLRPGTTPEQVRTFRASAPSGDWRPIEYPNGRRGLELVAVCQVNVPGFPVARAMVASGSQEVYALVAAGAAPLLRIKAGLDEASSNTFGSDVSVAAIREKFATARREQDEKRAAELSAKAEALSARLWNSADAFANVPAEKREALAKKGQALPDGSYPIATEADLKKAIQAYGRAKSSDREKVKKHIMKRARALGKADLIPDKWKPVSAAALTASVSDLRARVAAAGERKKVEEGPTPPQPEAGDFPKAPTTVTPEGERETETVPAEPNVVTEIPEQKGIYTPQTQPRDGQGRFRDILARLKDNLGVSGNQSVTEKLKKLENLDNAGDYKAANDAANDLVSTIDRLDSGALNATSLSNVRVATTQLGKAVANLPLPFDNQTAKVRYSDLPPALRTLTENLIDRVIDKIGVEDGGKATSELKGFMAGSDVFSQSEISAQLNRMLRLLT